MNKKYYFKFLNEFDLIYIRRSIEVVITDMTRNVVKLEEVPTATNPDFTGLF